MIINYFNKYVKAWKNYIQVTTEGTAGGGGRTRHLVTTNNSGKSSIISIQPKNRLGQITKQSIQHSQQNHCQSKHSEINQKKIRVSGKAGEGGRARTTHWQPDHLHSDQPIEMH